jgi:23S rRNA (adenine2503-C2)-methyltransferase
MENLRDISIDGLRAVAEEVGLKPFAADQLYRWLYQQGVESFDAMSNISLAAREALAQRFVVTLPQAIEVKTADDGTTKMLFHLADGCAVETVMIPAKRRDHAPRRTVCISTQVGCAMKCTFCHTGTMGLTRHLTQGEILGQIIAVRQQLAASDEQLTNIVLMGMGEPLHNYDTVVNAMRIMIDDRGLGFGKKRVTISTVGLAPAIRKLGKERLGVKLALSLHATTDAQRQELIPLARKYPLHEVLDACHAYCQDQPRRGEKVTFEYLMLRAVNDTPDDAQRLVQIASRVPSKVNLIPLNPYPGCPWERPEDARIERFASLLRNKGVQVNIRHSRGQEILAACGQLATNAKETAQ